MAEFIVSKNENSISEVLSRASDGDKIFIESGTYNESFVIDKAVEIEGDKNNIPIISIESGVVCKVKANATIKNIHFNNTNGIEPKPRFHGFHSLVEVSADAIFENCEFTGAFDGNIQVYGKDVKPKFYNCLIHDANRNGIFLIYGCKAIIKDCEIYNNGFHGISILNSSPIIENVNIHDVKGHGVFIIGNSEEKFKESEDEAKLVIKESAPSLINCEIHDLQNESSGILMYKNRGVYNNCKIYNTKGPSIVLYENDEPFSEEDSNIYTFNACDYYYDRIPSYCFSRNEDIISMVIPSYITTIGTEAFDSCCNMEELYIPSSVKIIDDKAFNLCSKLNIYVDEDNKFFCSVNGSLYSKDKSILIRASCDIDDLFELPKEVTTIGRCSFSGCNNIKNFKLPDSITKIEHEAFSYCENLESIKLPESVEYFGAKVFNSCSSLESVVLPKGITGLDVEIFYDCSSLKEVSIPEGVDTISHYVFGGCTSLEKIKLPESLLNIYKCAFDGCTALKDIVLPKNIELIEESAFEGCTALEKIMLPESLNTIDPAVFVDCSSKLKIELECNNSKFVDMRDLLIDLNDGQVLMVLDRENLSSSLEIPKGVTAIGESVFLGCENLKEVIIPETVTFIDSNAFKNCINLESITLPRSIKCFGNSVFEGCINLKKIKLPPIIEIPTSMFEGCEKLTDVIFTSKGILDIGFCAFMDCKSLQNIKLPKFSVRKSCCDESDYGKSINIGAFKNCKSLKNFIVPKGVEVIDKSAFEECSSLEKVVISSTVTEINEEAFANCKNLEKVTMPKNVYIADDAFAGCEKLK